MDVIFCSSVLCWNEKFSWWGVRTISVFVYLMLGASKWETFIFQTLGCPISIFSSSIHLPLKFIIYFFLYNWFVFYNIYDYLFIISSLKTFRKFHFIAIVNSGVRNIAKQVFAPEGVRYFEFMPKSVIAVHMVNLVLNFLWMYTEFHGGYTS